MGRRKIFTSVDIKALQDKSRDLSRVNREREVPSEDIFSWYVLGKEKDFTSSSIHDHRQKNNNDKPLYHHQCLFINGDAIIIIIIINNNNKNNNNNTLKVIYSSMLHNYQYSMWSLVHDLVRECVRWFID